MGANTVCAQGADDLARRELIGQAEVASRSGDHARAVEFAERAGGIHWSPSLRLFLANEYPHVGRLVDALSAASSCEREAQADQALRNRQTIEQNCHTVMESLRGRVGRVNIRFASPPPAGTTVTLAGQSVSQSLWGVPYAVNPGTVELVVAAPGMLAIRQSIVASAGQARDVSLTLVADPAAVAVTNTQNTNVTTPLNVGQNTGVSTTNTVTNSGSATAPIGVVPPPPPPPPSVVPWIVTGAGGALLVTSLAMFLVYRGGVAQLEVDCNVPLPGTQRGCPAADANDAMSFRTRIRSTETIGTVSAVMLGVGAVVVAGGISWGLLTRNTAPRATAMVVPTHDGAMLTIGGSL